LMLNFKILNFEVSFLKFNPFFTSKNVHSLMLSKISCFYIFKFSFLIVVLRIKMHSFNRIWDQGRGQRSAMRGTPKMCNWIDN
jgi:hypothetical protein